MPSGSHRAAAIALAYRQAAAALWLGAGLIWLAIGYLFNVVEGLGAAVAAVLVVAPALLMTIKPLQIAQRFVQQFGLRRGHREIGRASCRERV